MTGERVTRYLREICRQLDTGLDGKVLRRAAVVFMIPAATLAPSCAVYGAPPMVDYGAPFDDEICGNRIDDDSDGLIDCDDSDCASVELCLGCFDGIDNDGDGQADCDDATCEGTEGCVDQDGCVDEIDGDGDGAIDCDDPDCAGSPDCP